MTVQAASTPLPPGARLHWYEIYSVLGQGGFGVTYSGWDTNLNQAVAIKEYFPGHFAVRGADGVVRGSDADATSEFAWGLRRFIEEARTLARLRHPNIVRVLSVFEGNGTAYMVMEHERGADINDALKLRLLDDESQLLRVIHQLLDGLEYIHGQGFIHRDVKPSNILLRDDGTPVLIDFGSARRSLDNGPQQFTTVVSRGYAPYEQYDDSGTELRQGPWTDVYSLAATLYRVIVGRPPPDSLQRGTALLEGSADPLSRPVSRVGLSYSDQLIDAIADALAFRPSDRPQSVGDWRTMFPALPSAGGDLVRIGRAVAELVPRRDPAPDGAMGAAEGGARPESDSMRDRRAHLGHIRALVIDDEPYVLNMTVKVLESLGLRDVLTATDGGEALAVLDAQGEPPQVAICDLDMRGMDGIEFLRHLGARPRAPAVIVVGDEDRRILAAAEALARSHGLYLLGGVSKPVKPGLLGELLARLDMDRTALSRREVAMLSPEEFEAGLAADAVAIVFHPKVSIHERKVVGAEALARWTHPTKGILGPASFIPLAMELGKMQAVTDQVFDKAMRQAGNWRAEGSDLRVAVNFTIEDFNRLDLPEYIVGRAQAEGVDPAAVTLEVTESRVMRDFTVPLEILARLRLRGIGLAIDDFGTGYSAVERIRRIPFTEMKVDRAFVYGAAGDPAARTILESSIALGRSLGLTLVAEGVETGEDWELVERLGCDLVQGYFVARPMPGDEILDWASSWEARGR